MAGIVDGQVSRTINERRHGAPNLPKNVHGPFQWQFSTSSKGEVNRGCVARAMIDFWDGKIANEERRSTTGIDVPSSQSFHAPQRLPSVSAAKEEAACIVASKEMRGFWRTMDEQNMPSPPLDTKENISASENIMAKPVAVEEENPSPSVAMQDNNTGYTAPVSYTGTFWKGYILAILVALVVLSTVLLGGYMLFPAPKPPTMAEKFLDGCIHILINILYYFK